MDDPLHTIPSILETLSVVEREVGDFFGSLDASEIGLRVGDAWTPAQHLDHLNIAVSAAARAYTVSPWLLQLRFGRAHASRTYDDLRNAYRARLASGGGASGRYVPQRDDGGNEDPIVRRTLLLSRWYRVNARLQEGIGKWREVSMDRVRVPHPLLGRLTMRELAFFTIYHNRHHIDATKRRLPRFSSVAGEVPRGGSHDDRGW